MNMNKHMYQIPTILKGTFVFQIVTCILGASQNQRCLKIIVGSQQF